MSTANGENNRINLLVPTLSEEMVLVCLLAEYLQLPAELKFLCW